MKRFHAIAVFVGLALLGALIWGIGPGQLWAEMLRLGWGFLPLLLIEVVADLLHTVAWRHCLTGPHRTLPFVRLYSIRMAGYAVNYLTPTATVGGEVTMGTLLALEHRGPQAASAVIIGKLAYSLAQLLLVVGGSVLVLWSVPLPAGLWGALTAGSILLALGMGGFLAVQVYGKLGVVVRWLVARRLGGQILRKAAEHVSQLDSELAHFYKERPADFLLAVGWHALGMGCGIVQSWYFLHLLTGRPSLLSAAGVWFLSGWLDLLAFAIPSNIGVQEATRVLAFKAVGFSAALGMAYGVMLRLEQLARAGLGLGFYGVLLARSRRSAAAAGRRAPDQAA